jgi:hypothetical protein
MNLVSTWGVATCRAIDDEITIDGVAKIARVGLVAIVPGNVRHSVKALDDGRVISVNQALWQPKRCPTLQREDKSHIPLTLIVPP